MSLEGLLTQHFGQSLDRQLALADLLEDNQEVDRVAGACRPGTSLAKTRT
ncbi:MAG: hypothetical protein GYB64_10090 [Chloroflexi bacterium]|nr:hypothetical protein [Chloroflexota bacterium]